MKKRRKRKTRKNTTRKRQSIPPIIRELAEVMEASFDKATGGDATVDEVKQLIQRHLEFVGDDAAPPKAKNALAGQRQMYGPPKVMCSVPTRRPTSLGDDW